jgi:hypothetical protein
MVNGNTTFVGSDLEPNDHESAERLTDGVTRHVVTE